MGRTDICGKSSRRCALGSWRGSQVGFKVIVDIRSELSTLSVCAHGSSSTGGASGRDLGRYSSGTTSLNEHSNPSVNAAAPSPQRKRESCVLLVPPQTLAGDVDPERVVDLGRDPRLVHRIRRREGVALTIDVRRELDREAELALERRALLWGCGEYDLFLLEDNQPADAWDGDGSVLARRGIDRSLKL